MSRDTAPKAPEKQGVTETTEKKDKKGKKEKKEKREKKEKKEGEEEEDADGDEADEEEEGTKDAEEGSDSDKRSGSDSRSDDAEGPENNVAEQTLLNEVAGSWALGSANGGTGNRQTLLKERRMTQASASESLQDILKDEMLKHKVTKLWQKAQAKVSEAVKAENASADGSGGSGVRAARAHQSAVRESVLKSKVMLNVLPGS